MRIFVLTAISLLFWVNSYSQCTPPSAPIVNDAVRCGVGSVTLTVSTGCPVGSSLTYFTDVALTMPATGFVGNTTPTISATTNYFAACVDNTVPNCTSLSDQVTVTVNTPNVTFNTNSTSASCFAPLGGTITISNEANGTAPYTYSIDGINFGSSATFTGLSTGGYVVYVRDNVGCTNSSFVNVGFTGATVVLDSVRSRDVLCFGDSNGTINIFTSGGLPPVEYSINGGSSWIATSSFTGLFPGNYDIQVRDGSGCVINAGTQIVGEPPVLQLDWLENKHISCYGGQDGTIKFWVQGGTQPYQYSIDSGRTWQDNELFDTLRVGPYICIVRDANGCFIMQRDTLWQPVAPLVIEEVHIRSNTCATNGTANFTVDATGGTAPYAYSIDGGAFQNSNMISNVLEGPHSVNVRDANGCLATNYINLNLPSPPNIVFSIVENEYCSQNNGRIRVNTIGGAGQNIYRWNDGTIGDSLTLMNEGRYIVTVTDLFGCTDVDTVDLENEYNYNVLGILIDSSKCGKDDGFVKVLTTGGQQPFIYQIIGLETNQDLSNNDGTFHHVRGGNSEVIITDNTGCVFRDTINVGPTNPTTIFEAYPASAVITSVDTLILYTNIPNGTGGSFSWTPSNSLSCYNCPTPVASPDVNTLYYVTYQDTNGCKYADTVLVNVRQVSRGLALPSAFTPNADNQNETYYVNGTNIAEVTIFRVYDRWGSLLFEQKNIPVNNPAYGWDGTFKGKKQPVGTYIYYVEAIGLDRKKNYIKGDFLLLE